ncbi:LRR receptor-like serine/threonine-protein kinase GSO2, partial [Olea europaea var. sylvestris]|uniref:LRR receptor-like serine/threonine-protein kinase GSO2 n=1 Tax=Olea europaea var. sylvestris TaxID=158386 RepID=UPI000C1D0F42
LNEWSCFGCWEEERSALLQLKENINFPVGKSLSSWIAADCCLWQGVECSRWSRRVTQLNLGWTRDPKLGDWHFNASLFLPFEDLKTLSLWSNNLVGWIENEGFDRLSKLRNLEGLGLGENSFNRSILASLSQLSSLKNLNLRDSFLPGKTSADSHERLSRLSKLEILDFSLNSVNDSDVLSVLNLNDFNSLKELDISGDQFRSLGNINGLKNLKFLSLHANNFNNSIFSSLQGLSSLKYLGLSRNKIKGSIQMNESHALSNLVELELSYNEVDNFTASEGIKSMCRLEALYLDGIKSNVSNMLQSLTAFSNLRKLFLRNNSLEGMLVTYALRNLSQLEGLYLDFSSLDANFLQSIGGMTSLKFLTLSECGLNGTLPAQGIVTSCSWEGLVPSCLGNMTSLRFIDLSYNRFVGNIAFSPLPKLKSLEYLSLRHNNFQVPISFELFSNHSNLRVIIAGTNQAIAETVSHNWIPTFQLQIFSMANCTGDLTIPKFLHYQFDLRMLDLSRNGLRGNFPSWLLENNTRLKGANLGNNALTGPLQLPSSAKLHMALLDISNNDFRGEVPTNISAVFPNFIVLNLSRNEFDGCVPSTLGDLKSLEILDLSNNKLSGQLPQELGAGCSSLFLFKMSNNKLQGQIFPEFINLPTLAYLYLDSNEFSGTIPDSLSTIPLEVLDISNNSFSGRLPISMGKLTTARQVSMSKNQLGGPIPLEFCNLDNLVLFDLSENNLSGSIPSCFNPRGLSHIFLNNNLLEGQLSYAFYNRKSLVTLDLRENRFTGNIPHWIDNLSSLSVILLKGNHFEGTIPEQLCQMKRLSLIDLSYNDLSGQIPHCLGNITLEVTRDKSSIFGVSDSIGRGQMEMISVSFYKKLYFPSTNVPIETVFSTKRNSYSYKGGILDHMSGIDLSSNKLHGEIPEELGMLREIHALNLSHNNLTGTMPATFSNLHQIESLDLSYNSLNGRIPTGLTDLNSLAVFSVANNNLSGMIPEKGQFGTFDEGCYKGNPFLCGRPLPVNCESMSGSPIVSNEETGFMDMDVFYISFAISCVSVVLCMAAVLYINPHWRRVWFHLIDVYIVRFLCRVFVFSYFIVNKMYVVTL